MYRYKKREENKKIIKLFVGVFIAILLLMLGLVLYQRYQEIEITEENQNSNYTAEKTKKTIEEVKEESKEVADMIEEVTSSVVGISKIKNAGSTIFLNDSATSLGLGTGVIVSDNGYILTNEHVSGSKYGNCYVTLENGSTYNANVVWSDSDIDLSIIKINEKNLSYAKLGDSDNIRVGETVFAIRKSNWI